MPTFKIDDADLNDLIAKLRQLEPKVANKILRDASKKALDPVKRAVQSLAPKRTGALSRSVKIRPGKRKKNTISRVVEIGEGFWKGKTWYGAAVEMGHYTGRKIKGTFKGKAGKARYARASALAGRKLIPGVHFMKRAFSQTKETAKEIAQTEILKAIYDAAKE